MALSSAAVDEADVLITRVIDADFIVTVAMIHSQGKAKYLSQGGLRNLAEDLHGKYGNRITCPHCPRPEPPLRAFCKDEGGKGAEGGLKRRQFRCRNAGKRRKESGQGCPLNSCTSYIKRAIQVLGEDRVDQQRRETHAALVATGDNVSSIGMRLRLRSEQQLHVPQQPPTAQAAPS
jgi:hypothetical protein